MLPFSSYFGRSVNSNSQLVFLFTGLLISGSETLPSASLVTRLTVMPLSSAVLEASALLSL